MSSFTLTNMAKADLKDIGRYTLNKWGREQRNHYLSILDACFRQLAENPLKGKDCSEIRSGYRKFNVGSHTIFNRQIISDSIEIVRVLHGHMDAEHHLSGVSDVIEF
ncbi:MAG: type II toxin-antitoxin system RelE/ParE family toxin [Deltaproteobacteria bacterium]|nr:type II toxin-antitoxin system RelE/ParE family toxin [Deltaproteobacteria bacterium]